MKNETVVPDKYPKISIKLMVQAAQPIQHDLSIERGYLFCLYFPTLAQSRMVKHLTFTHIDAYQPQ